MTRSLKLAGLGIGSIVGLAAVLLAALVLLVDPNHYKGEISTVVKDKTGMDLVLADKLEWTLWPALGVRLGHVTLTDPGSGEQLVGVEKAAVAVQVVPLFSKKIAIDSIDLDGAQVRFVEYAKGGTSWDTLLAKLKSSPQQEKSAPVQVKIKSLDISHSQLTLIDQKTGTTRQLQNVELHASDIGPDAAIPLAAQFLFTQQDAAGKTLSVQSDIKGQAQTNSSYDKLQLSGLAVKADLGGNLLPAPISVALQTPAASADLQAQQAKVDQLALEVDEKDPALASPAVLKLNGNIAVDLKQMLITVSGLSADASYPAKNLRAPATLKLSGALTADIGKSLLNVTGLKAQASYPDKTREAPITAALATDVRAQWQSGELNLPNLIVNAEYPDKSFPQPLSVSLSSAVSGNWKQGQLGVSSLLLRALGVEARGQVTARLPALAATAKPGTPLMSGMSVNGAIATGSFNPQAVAQALGIALPRMQDPKSLSSASLSATIAGNDNSLLLKGLRLQLDGSSMSGDAGISDLKTFRLYARLNLDKINVDNYLPPANTAGAGTSAGGGSSAPSGPLLPVDLLRKQNLDVALSAGSLTVMSYPIAGLQLAATASGGLVNVSSFRGNIYSGSFSLPTVIDARGSQPQLSVKPALNQIEIGPLAQKLLKKDLIAGKVNAAGDLRLSGNSSDAWLKSLNGSGNFHLQNGILHGVNLMQAVMDQFSKYQALLPLLTGGRDAAGIVSSQSDTPIAALDSTAVITNGVVNQTSINADLNKAKLSGSGTLNLVSKDADYRLSMTLAKNVVGAKYSAYAIPLRCTGNLNAAAKLCNVDANAVRDLALKAATDQGLQKLGISGGSVQGAIDQKKQEAQGKLQQQVRQQKQNVQNQLQQKLNQGLQGLFGH